MTISAQGVRAIFLGSGSAGPFTLEDPDSNDILFVSNAEIVATRFDDEGVPDVLTIITDYTLTGAGSTTAGSLTLTTPLAIGETLVIQRVTPKTQVIDLISGGKLGNHVLEGFFDKLIRLVQETSDLGVRALKFPITYSGDELDFPLPEEGYYIGWSDDGLLENKLPPASFFSGSAVPDDADGNNGDFYFRTNGDVYKKVFGTWVVQFSAIGPQGDPGTPGPTGQTGNGILNGSGAPSDSLGNDGDFYLDTVDYDIYGPKTGGTWGAGVSIVGPAGAGSGDVVGPGSAASNNLTAFDGTTGKLLKDSGIATSAVLTTSAAAAAYQPLDADLTAIAALTTTATGRSLLAAADAAAIATIAGVGTGNSPQFTAINLGHASDTTLARSAAGIMTVEGAAVLLAGKHAIPISAGAMSPRATSGAGQGTFGVGIPTLDFDSSTQEYAVFAIAMPKSWNEGTVSFVPYWTNTAGLTTETVRWTLAAVALSNDDAAAAPTFGTAQNSDDTWIAQNDIHIGPESSAITIGGSPAQDDIVFFQLSRDVANDNLTGDAKLIAIKLFITTDAPTDV